MILYFDGQKVKINIDAIYYNLNIAPRSLNTVISDNQILTDINGLQIKVYE